MHILNPINHCLYIYMYIIYFIFFVYLQKNKNICFIFIFKCWDFPPQFCLLSCPKSSNLPHVQSLPSFLKCRTDVTHSIMGCQTNRKRLKSEKLIRSVRLSLNSNVPANAVDLFSLLALAEVKNMTCSFFCLHTFYSSDIIRSVCQTVNWKPNVSPGPAEITDGAMKQAVTGLENEQRKVDTNRDAAHIKRQEGLMHRGFMEDVTRGWGADAAENASTVENPSG